MQQLSEKRKILVSLLNSSKISRVINGNFSYRSNGDTMFNETLFTQYAGFEYSEDINFLALEMTIKVKLSVTKEIIGGLKEHFSEDDIIYSSIIESLNLISLSLLSLPYELEKAGYIINQETQKQQQEREREILILETMLYGKRISSSPDESAMCLTYIKKKLQDNTLLIGEFEKEEFQNFIDIIEDKVMLQETYTFPKILKESVSFKFFRRYGNLPIPKEKYIQIFRLALDISGMKEHEILLWNGGNISITRESLLIPESSSYSELTLQRVLCIITHEIMVHGISWKNQKRFFGMFKGGGYGLKEEGLAIYMESRMLGENRETINLKPMASARILAGEILNGDDFLKFIKIYRKLTGQKTGSVKKTFLRHKLYHSIVHSGGSRSDLSYLRGLKAVSKYVLDQKNISYLFSGKISLSQAEKYGPKLTKNKRFVCPIPISDYIIYSLFEDKKPENFSVYLEKKYPDIHHVFRDIITLSENKKQKITQLNNIFAHIIYG